MLSPKNDQITVRLLPGDHQLISQAASKYGMTISAFCRLIASGAAQKILEYEEAKDRGEVLDAEWVRECEIKSPTLPNVPPRTRFEKAENAVHTTITRRSRG